MPLITDHPAIDGVKLIHLKPMTDARGRFMETFRTEWFPDISWQQTQMNRSDSNAGVLRGLHYHFGQLDYWVVQQGTIRAGLADLRPHSPTYLHATTLDIGQEEPIGLLIPIGVAHGFYALTDVTVMYLVNRYYDSKDEFGVAWNDPTLQVPWGITAPTLSHRDQANPLLEAIPPHLLPK